MIQAVCNLHKQAVTHTGSDNITLQWGGGGIIKGIAWMCVCGRERKCV